MTTRPAVPTPIPIDPLFDDGPEAMVERFGRYRTYGQHERIELEIGRGLLPRHDSVMNFIRTGGLRRAEEDPTTLAARTSYFREEYGYGDRVYAPGIEGFLRNPRLEAAAREVHGLPVVEPAIAYANLMVPGQELAVHTDVPEFRGANRKVFPQWLLVVMLHSGLFDAWRLRIATGIAWFHDSDHGALAYWPDGPDGAVRRHRIRANTALVLDTDSTFHGVDRVTDDSAEVVPPVRSTTVLEPRDGRWALVADDGAGEVVATYDFADLRFSVSWKAYCFADEDDRDRWRHHEDGLELDTVLASLVDDLRRRGVDADGPQDPALGRTLIDTYVRFPVVGG
ncbi:MAG: hypothetical protein KF703_13625 [Actinobacteria bacterium]|nr:hypothetical protein [Actinomycetota bacterium]